MKKLFLILTLFLIFTACFSARQSGVNKNVSAVGLKVPKKGLTIDANYDPRLDNLIPGYKVITIALTNNSFEVLKLNPLKDRWVIEDANGRKHKATNSVRIQDPRVFAMLPAQVKKLIDYPSGISVGYTETFDVFFPEDTDLEAFRSVSFYNSGLGENFDIVSIAEDDPRHQQAPAEVEVPENFPNQYKQYYNPKKIPTKGTFKKIKSAQNEQEEEFVQWTRAKPMNFLLAN